MLTGLLLSQSAKNPVTITAFVDAPARAGEVVNIKIDAEMEDQWHIYSIYEITSQNQSIFLTQGLRLIPITTKVILVSFFQFD